MCEISTKNESTTVEQYGVSSATTENSSAKLGFLEIYDITKKKTSNTAI